MLKALKFMSGVICGSVLAVIFFATLSLHAPILQDDSQDTQTQNAPNDMTTANDS